MFTAALVLLAVVLNPFLLAGQNTDGQKIFAGQCAGCHGADAHGTDRGPGLAASRRVRSRSVQQLRDFIRKGAPGSGMPAFDLPADQLDALAALLRSLNAPAAESVALGDSAAGKRFFLGEGKCASCHMVSGGGKAIGPDLSDVGARMTVEEIREALLNPGAHTAPGYALVTVKLRDGRTIRGFAKNRSNFDIGVQDLEGQFHSLQEEQISSIEDEKKSLMEPVKASPDQLRDLIAYLGRLTGVTPGMPATAGPSGCAGNRLLTACGSQARRLADLQRQARR